jgi:hypothetical protein
MLKLPDHSHLKFKQKAKMCFLFVVTKSVTTIQKKLKLRHLHENPYLIFCTTLSRKAVKETKILKWPVIILLRKL